MDNREFEKTFSSIKQDMEADEGSAQPGQGRTIPNRNARQAQGQKNTRKRTSKKQRRVRIVMVVILAILLIALSVFALKSCSGDSSLSGTWRIDDTTVYEFDGKGSGVLHTSLNDYAFTYTVEDDTLRIDFASSAATDTTYQYSIKGNTLTFERGGETYKLTKD